LLWGDGIPQLSILISPRRGRVGQIWVQAGETVQVLGPEDDGGRGPEQADAAEGTGGAGGGEPAEPSTEKRRSHGRGHAQEVAFDLAVVNNGALALDTVSLIVTFAQRTATGRRTAIVERGLFWPAELRPGRAVKWEVEAEGSEFRVDCELSDKLGVVPAATADSFYGLLDARLTVVRLHGAMMLAYLGDARARQAAMSLGPLSARSELARGELLRTQQSLRLCDRKPQHGGLELCVHNGTDRLVRAVALTEAGEQTEAPRRWQIADYFLPGRGLRLTLPLAGAQPPTALQVTEAAAPAKPP
jgi:hypothetical protein